MIFLVLLVLLACYQLLRWLLEDHSQLSNIHRDIAEMERLISELLEAERLNTRHSPLQLENVDLVDLVELVSELVREEFRDGLIRVEMPV
jgi:signal transduction histidine kinase